MAGTKNYSRHGFVIIFLLIYFVSAHSVVRTTRASKLVDLRRSLSLAPSNRPFFPGSDCLRKEGLRFRGIQQLRSCKAVAMATEGRHTAAGAEAPTDPVSPEYISSKNTAHRLAYHYTPGTSPGVMFLTGTHVILGSSRPMALS